MLLLPLLLFFPSLVGLLFATQNSALYRYPTGRASSGKFKRDPFYFSWAENMKYEYETNSYHCDCQPGFSGTHCKRGGVKFAFELRGTNSKVEVILSSLIITKCH